MICSKCGDDKKSQGFAMHEANCKGGGVAVAERPTPYQPRSQRARRQFQVVSTLDQIKNFPSQKADSATGAWAYYLRDTGIEATIREVLIPYPNGGIPDIEDKKLQGQYGTNADYYRQRQARKGLVYIGPILNESGLQKMIAIIEKNKPDAILYCEDMIANCAHDGDTLPDPKERGLARRRQAIFEARLKMLTQPIDPDALLAELREIAQGQELAAINPRLRRVMQRQISEGVAAAMAKFSTKDGGKPSGTLESVQGEPFFNADD